MKKCLAGKSDRSSGRAVKPQDSWSHYKRRGTQGKAQPKPWSDTSKGLEHHSPPGHLGDASESGGLLWSSLYPRSWQQKEVAVPHSLQERQPWECGSSNTGPQISGRQADNLGQVEAGREQDSKDSPDTGRPQAVQISAPAPAPRSV